MAVLGMRVHQVVLVFCLGISTLAIVAAVPILPAHRVADVKQPHTEAVQRVPGTHRTFSREKEAENMDDVGRGPLAQGNLERFKATNVQGQEIDSHQQFHEQTSQAVQNLDQMVSTLGSMSHQISDTLKQDEAHKAAEEAEQERQEVKAAVEREARKEIAREKAEAQALVRRQMRDAIKKQEKEAPPAGDPDPATLEHEELEKQNWAPVGAAHTTQTVSANSAPTVMQVQPHPLIVDKTAPPPPPQAEVPAASPTVAQQPPAAATAAAAAAASTAQFSVARFAAAPPPQLQQQQSQASLPPQTCFKWIPSMAQSQVKDSRKSHFAWSDKSGQYMYVVGGCHGPLHLPNCKKRVQVYDTKSHMWDGGGLTLDIEDDNWMTSFGNAWTRDAISDVVYDFGGTRAKKSGNGNDVSEEQTSWLGALAVNKQNGHYEWKKLALGVKDDDVKNAPPPLSDATATFVDNQVVIFGGSTGSAYSSDVYAVHVAPGDKQFKWEKKAVEGSAPSPRAGHSATRAGNKLYIFGGTDGNKFYDDLHALVFPGQVDGGAWKWEILQPHNAAYAPSARAYHSAFMQSSLLLIAGGVQQSENFVKDLLLYNTVENQWLQRPASLLKGVAIEPFARSAVAACGKAHDQIFFTGGDNAVFTYDIFKPRVLDLNAVCVDSCQHGKFNDTKVAGLPMGVCQCDSDWSGKFCSVNKKCPNSCSDRGTCTDGVCKCKLGFGGTDCSVPVCPNSCGTPIRGICSDTEKRCICKPGFWGLDCSQNNCENNCMGRGICQEADKEHSNNWCKCQPGFSGPGCEQWGIPNNTSPGDSFLQLASLAVPVKNLNTSNATNTSKGAEIVPGPPNVVYDAGFSCPNHCTGHGTCTKTRGVDGSVRGVCKCEAGFGGVDCSGECTLHCSVTHKNGATEAHGECTGADPLTVKCKCNLGYRSAGCFEPYCALNCSGNGVCQEETCLCHPPYAGAACELDITCSGNGVLEGSSCRCNEGYGGFLCKSKVECPGGCKNGGTCRGAKVTEPGQNVSGGVCDCSTAPGWRGDLCDKRTCPQECSHNGRCDDLGKCHCYPGFSGSSCETRLACPNNCTNGQGTCKLHDNSTTASAYCDCNPGWGGPACNDLGCPQQCYHRGTCVRGKCDCHDGYSGKLCGTECPKRCSSHGLCLDDGTCKCHPGFSGVDCSQAAKCPGHDKPGGVCSGRGSCFAPKAKCYCPPTHTGDDCSKLKECPNNCGGHGMCSGGKCLCDPGWDGVACERKSSCQDNCTNNGFCMHGRCHCYTGFAGEFCERQTFDPTCKNNCSGFGICERGRCICAPGQTGEDCSNVTDMDKCRRYPNSAQLCEGKGSCRFSRCYCDAGYAGEFCESLEVCPNGCDKGTCINGVCQCHPGAKGVDCSEDIVCPGTPLSCSGNGVCLQGSCTCFPSYIGGDCAKLKPGVSNATCLNNCTDGGVCHMGRCFCVEGRQGADCSMKTQESCPRDCSGNGICRFGQCFCRPGFAGKGCERALKCDVECDTNGVCAYGHCFCVAGWVGKNCQTPASHLERKRRLERSIESAVELGNQGKDPCQGCGMHGVCVNSTCACESPYYGPQCQFADLGPVAHRCGNQCSGHGECLFGKCFCHPGHSGEQCERQDQQLCPAGCHGRGICSLGACFCDPGFKGEACETKETCKDGCVASHGFCIRGKCKCVQGWKGLSCNQTDTTQGTAAPQSAPTPVSQPAQQAPSQTPGQAARFSEVSGSEDALSPAPCQVACGDNGLCVSDECYCKQGFTGPDCSTTVQEMSPTATEPLVAAPLAAARVSAPTESGLSVYLMMAMAFAAGVLSCVAVQTAFTKLRDMQHRRATTNILKPLLHSIDS